MKIRKAVIPAAGLGTRFLPATKAQPKEMFPIVDKPTIQFVVEEAVKSGIEDIIIITGRTKKAIEDFFDRSIELELELERTYKDEMLSAVRRISSMANVYYIRQQEPRGLGHAILCARTFVGNEPFAVLLGDDIVYSPDQPALSQLIDVYEQTHSSVLGVQHIDPANSYKYGIVSPATPFNGSTCRVSDLVEKPEMRFAPSDIAIMGRYVLTPGIMEVLSGTPAGLNGEIQLTDALRRMLQIEPIYACRFEGQRYDVGDKLGYLSASVEYALRREDLSAGVAEYLAQIALDKNLPVHEAIARELKRRSGK
jgi:UTP--glucose-1-phosphate uridylyltransferase